jgi:hypothetical protein
MHRNDLVDEFVRLLISKLDTDVAIKTLIGKKHTKLIEEIKNIKFQSPNVVLYASIVLDINIIVMLSDSIELYSGDDTLDMCKPFIILYRNGQGIYNPVCYEKNFILTYYDHDIVGILVTSKYYRKHE